MELVIFIIVCAVIGCIPAAIAQSKGRGFLVWWFYGALLFLIALIHSLMLEPEQKAAPQMVAAPPSTADELTKFADLRDRGVITSEEFDAQKKRIMDALAPSVVTRRPAMGEGQY